MTGGAEGGAEERADAGGDAAGAELVHEFPGPDDADRLAGRRTCRRLRREDPGAFTAADAYTPAWYRRVMGCSPRAYRATHGSIVVLDPLLGTEEGGTSVLCGECYEGRQASIFDARSPACQAARDVAAMGAGQASAGGGIGAWTWRSGRARAADQRLARPMDHSPEAEGRRARARECAARRREGKKAAARAARLEARRAARAAARAEARASRQAERRDALERVGQMALQL